MKNGYDGGRFERLARAMSRNHDITVKLSGTAACTDGKTIYIPANSDDFKEADAQVLHGLLDHETAHVWEEEEARRNHKPTPLELLTPIKDNATKAWFNIFEDVRIERSAAKRYTGIAENISLLNAHAIDKHKKQMKAGKKYDAWSQVMIGALTVLDGKNTDWLSPAVEIVLSMIADEIEEGKHTTSAEQTMKLAKRVVKKLREHSKEGEGGMPSDKEPKKGDKKDGKKGSGKTKKDPKKDKGEEEEGSDPDMGDGDPSEMRDGDTESKEDPTSKEGKEEGDKKDPKKDSDDDTGTGDIGPHKEGDSHESEEDKKAKKAAEDLIDEMKKADADSSDIVKEDISKEIEKASTDSAKRSDKWMVSPEALKQDRIVVQPRIRGSYAELKKEVAKQASTLKQKLVTLLRARTQKRMSGDQERGVLDAASLYSLKFNNQRVFAAPSSTTQLDTAVFILVDQSGSMDGSKCRATMLMSVALGDALESLNVPFEVFGFTNPWHRKGYTSKDYSEMPWIVRVLPFDFLQYKSFDEPFKGVRDRLANIQGMGENVDGDAIEFAARRLISRQERRKIMIVLSDGAPDGGVTDTARSREHLREEVKKATSNGIEVLGIGAKTDAVAKYYNKETGAHHIVIHKLDDLANEAFKAFKAMLTKAI